MFFFYLFPLIGTDQSSAGSSSPSVIADQQSCKAYHSIDLSSFHPPSAIKGWVHDVAEGKGARDSCRIHNDRVYLFKCISTSIPPLTVSSKANRETQTHSHTYLKWHRRLAASCYPSWLSKVNRKKITPSNCSSHREGHTDGPESKDNRSSSFFHGYF